MTVEEWLGKDNKLGIDIWHKKYQRNNETFDEWLDRVSGNNKLVRGMIERKEFLFGGRILANRGVKSSEEKTTLSNCYVIRPPEDSIESIYDTCKLLARTYSYGGGCGIDISKLAPGGARVHNQAKTTSGAVSFMDTFSQVTEQIGQNGRRGALMISLSCSHPDVERFITIKSDLKKVNFANISVRVTDKFMEAVENDSDWTLFFERPETNERIEKVVKAKDLFQLLCKQNWDYAEPGILFWDTIEGYNLLSNNPDFHYAGVNPCAEEPLPAGGSCNLGSINLAAFVNDDGEFDFNRFCSAVELATLALDMVLDEGIDKHPLEEQRESVRHWRQQGLGIFGLADCLIKMKLKYGSPDSLYFCNYIGSLMAGRAIAASGIRARNLETYQRYTPDVMTSSFFEAHKGKLTQGEIDNIAAFGLRNSQLLTIAPTGTLSTMLGVSGGIEPIFANYYTRTTKSLHDKDVTYKVYTPIVEEYMKAHGITDDADLPDYFVTSATIPIEDRIAMQAVWQKHIDASISSTVNLPNEATVEDVEKLYMLAWKSGLKGITVFRAGCARTAILNAEPKANDKKDESVEKDSEDEKDCKNNPDTVSGDVIGLEHHLTTGCGSLHICAYFDQNGNLRNTYLSKGSSGGCNNFMIGLSRMISLAARNGVSIHDIVDQLKSCGTCPSYAVRRATQHDVSPGSCCPVAIGNALMEMWEKFNRTKMQQINSQDCTKKQRTNSPNYTKMQFDEPPKGADQCPECGGELKHEMGCVTCTSCGYSKCN